MSQFEGKTAVVTGGAEGIGLAIARSLGREKMNIVIADIDPKNTEKATAALKEEGIDVLGVTLDVADESQWQAVASQVVEHFGKIHMVVNNAGVGGETGPIENNDGKGWQWTLEVNLMGVVYGTKTMVPYIKEHGEGGWIINTASMAGMAGVPFAGAYTATKNAVVAMSESWAVELGQQGIQVSVLCPAFVQTRIHESHRNRQDKFKTEVHKANAKQMYNKAKALVEGGIDAGIVGDRVVEALNAKELYIFTHPNYRPVAQHRARLIDEAFERAAQSPLLQHLLDQPMDSL